MGSEHSSTSKVKQPSSIRNAIRRSLSPKKKAEVKPPPMNVISAPAAETDLPAAESMASRRSVLSAGGKGKLNLTDFELKLTLGTGTFGRVMLARHPSTNSFVAIKILKKEKIVRLKQVEHVTYEKKLLEKINSPFIVNYLDSFKDCRNIYIIMEYVKGGELFSFLRKSGRFTDEMARFYAAEVVLAFEYLHNQDIIYRDLKPENILLDSSGHIKIADFGFAKVVRDRTWTICGTPEYLAPEIILSKGYGKAVDWWALGVLVYEMLCGFAPFYDEDPYEIYEKIVACKVRYPTHLKPSAKDLISNLLQVDLTKRYGNLKDGVNDIKNHSWFEGVNWAALGKLEFKPYHIPIVANDADTSNFQRYEEEPIDGLPVIYDPFEELFANW
jgi:serine/threonine protein kinase